MWISQRKSDYLVYILNPGRALRFFYSKKHVPKIVTEKICPNNRRISYKIFVNISFYFPGGSWSEDHLLLGRRSSKRQLEKRDLTERHYGTTSGLWKTGCGAKTWEPGSIWAGVTMEITASSGNFLEEEKSWLFNMFIILKCRITVLLLYESARRNYQMSILFYYCFVNS